MKVEFEGQFFRSICDGLRPNVLFYSIVGYSPNTTENYLKLETVGVLF